MPTDAKKQAEATAKKAEQLAHRIQVKEAVDAKVHDLIVQLRKQYSDVWIRYEVSVAELPSTVVPQDHANHVTRPVAN